MTLPELDTIARENDRCLTHAANLIIDMETAPDPEARANLYYTARPLLIECARTMHSIADIIHNSAMHDEKQHT
jgi:hypothetical protein